MQSRNFGSNHHQWGDWSPWAWNEPRQAFGRFRRDGQGNVEYEWERLQSTAGGPSDVSPPTNIDIIAQGFRQLQTTFPDPISPDYPPPTTSTQVPVIQRPRLEKGKNVVRKDQRDDFPSPGHDVMTPYQMARVQGTEIPRWKPAPVPLISPTSGSRSSPQPWDQHGQESSSNTSSPYTSTFPPVVSYSGLSSSWDFDPSNTKRQSDNLQRSLAQARDPFNSLPFSLPPPTTTTTTTSTPFLNPLLQTSSVPPPGNVSIPGNPNPLPRDNVSKVDTKAAIDEEVAEMDARYRVEHSSKFAPGEIFKVHWSEPEGSGNDSSSSSTNDPRVQNKFGTKFFVGFRRYVVVANDQGHCTCVPIFTYGGKGCKKKGVKPDKHGIIYERGHRPRRLEGEPALGYAPIQAIMRQDGEKLTRDSRINYSKLVSVEHNIKVFFLGSVTTNDCKILSEAVNDCWNKKIHQVQR